MKEYIECGCGCGEHREKYDKRGREMKYIRYHRQTLGTKGNKGHKSWNSGTRGKCNVFDCDKPNHGKGCCVKHYQKLYYIHNSQKIKKRIKAYNKNNPHIKLKNGLKNLNKIGKLFDICGEEYKWLVDKWSKTIKIRDNYTCQICGFKGDNSSLNSHHIFYKNKYPQLSLNLNNGITLCLTCHKEIHYAVANW